MATRTTAVQAAYDKAMQAARLRAEAAAANRQASVADRRAAIRAGVLPGSSSVGVDQLPVHAAPTVWPVIGEVTPMKLLFGGAVVLVGIAALKRG